MPRTRRSMMTCVSATPSPWPSTRRPSSKRPCIGHGTRDPHHDRADAPYYNKDIAIGGPDIAGAKKLLAEAGYPDGFKTTIYVPGGRPPRERVGITVSELLKPVGIDVDVQRVPWDKFVKDIEGKEALYVDGFFSRPTIDTSIYPWYHSKGSWNTVLWNYKNEAMDKVLDAARGAKSDEERAKLYKEFQVLAVNEPAGVRSYVLNHVNAFRKNVKAFQSSPDDVARSPAERRFSSTFAQARRQRLPGRLVPVTWSPTSPSG